VGQKREIYCKLFHGMKLSESLLEGLVTPLWYGEQKL